MCDDDDGPWHMAQQRVDFLPTTDNRSDFSLHTEFTQYIHIETPILKPLH